MTVKVSVIVPVFNVEKYLSCCLDSLLKQTLNNIEIICVNDGSTDNSLQILQEYAKKSAQIKIISQENGGLGYARNVGVQQAKGDYIGFVDSDDFVSSDFLEKLYTAAVKFNADVVLTNFYIYNNETKEVYPYRDMKLIHRLSEANSFTAKEYPDVLLNVGSWDKLYKRDFLIKNGIKFPEKRIYEDFNYTYYTLTRAKQIVALTDRLYYYRKNTGTSITDQEKRNDLFKFDFLKNFNEIKSEWINTDYEKLFRTPIVQLQIRDGYFHHSNILNKKTFKKFFDIMASIFDEKDAEIICAQKNENHIKYAQYLLSGNCKKCYKMFREC